MSAIFRRLASKSATPTRASPGGGGGRSLFKRLRLPIGVAVAAATGVAYFCYDDTPITVHGLVEVHLKEPSEENAPQVVLDPKKQTEFKIQDTATASHNIDLYRLTVNYSKKHGLNVAASPIERNAPDSDPAVEEDYGLLIKLFPGPEMSRRTASWKGAHTLEAKGEIEE
ncbi:unnamed protein product [Linum tenue]|uniref:Uncharacterized protein n=1 Tax=Linum tenue TaxID=586396 RepID=A0AAV0HWE3_9ROSI|nr:unnamed protein product [Linum tenue]